MDKAATIRPMTEDDLNTVLVWRNHPSIRMAMFTCEKIDFEQHRAWFNKVNRDPERRLYIIETQREPLGFVQFTNVAPGAVSDWGFYVQPDARKGSGRLLGFAALDHAFGPLGLHKVCGQALAFNKASIRMHRVLGFQKEGELREQHKVEGNYHSVICFGLLRQEWQLARTVLVSDQTRNVEQ